MRSVRLRRRSCPPQGRFRGLLDKRGRGRRSVGPPACGMLAAICRRASPAPSAKPPLGLATLRGLCLGSPDRPRCKASLLGLPADMPGTRRGAPDSRRPARAASPPNCRRRAGVARNSVGMPRVRRAAARPGQQPRGALSGHAAGGVPRGGGGERSPWPPRRVRTRRGGSCFLCAGGTGGGPITSTPKVGPSRQAGGMARWGCSGPNEEPWLRGGRLWRKAALFGFGCRSSCSRAPLAESRPIGNSPQWDDSA